MGAVAYGIFGVAILVGMVGGSAFGNTLAKRAGFVRSVVVGLTVAGAGIAAMAVFPHFIFNMVCLFVVGVGVGAVNAVISTRIMVATAPELRGRVAGLLSALLTLASPLGAAVVGWASGPLGLLWLFRLSGFLIFLLAFGLMGLPESPEAVASSPTAGMPAES
jgi:putative MFS transporter